MTTLEQAARQALETLERASDAGYSVECDETITALREALEQVAPRKTERWNPMYSSNAQTALQMAAVIAHRDTEAAPPAEQQATKETLGGVNGWRDISTAPKDGSRFVAIGYNYGLYSEGRHTCVAQWFRGCWMEASDWNEPSELRYLTHWMPLPSPPDDAAELNDLDVSVSPQQAAPKAAPGAPSYSEKWDAELGRTAMRFVDRAGDVHPGIDDAETICAEFYKAMSEVIERMPHVQRMTPRKAAPVEQNTVPAEWLEQAYREGWAACRDAETIGEEAEDWAFGNSTANSRMIDAQQAAPQQEAQEPWGYARKMPGCGWGFCSKRQYEEAVADGDETKKLYATPQPAPAPLSEMPYEKRKAIQEGEQISASDAWFKARHEMLDTLDRRNVFRAGFDRGWNAALAAQGGE
mgnify:CR=1 FL=1